MKRANRSAGVTAAAIVALAGSSLMVLFFLLTVLSILIFPRLQSAGRAVPTSENLKSSMAMAAAFYACLAAWGIATGVGLLRLKAWARASILVFSGLMEITALACIPVLFIMSRMPILQREPPGAAAGAMVVVGAVMGLMAALGVWWLVLFNLKSVRAQFDETGVTGAYSEGGDTAQARAMKPRRPLSITLIGLMYLLASPAVLIAFFRPYPAFLMGLVIEGNAAVLVYAVYGALALILGIGLLMLKPWARILGICLSAIHLLGGWIAYFTPGGLEKMLAVSLKLSPRPAPPVTADLLRTMLPIGMLFGSLFSLAIIWFLVVNKAAFTPQAAERSAVPS